MPRDPSGNYTLPALGNPAVTGTPITIAWWNGTGSDLASAITDSLSRTGSGGMLGPFGAVDGTAGAPGLTFQAETNTGLYRATTGEMDVTVQGTRLARWTTTNYLQTTKDNGSTWLNPVYNTEAATLAATTCTATGGALGLTVASSATNIDVEKVNGYIDLSGATNPAATTGFANRLTPKNILKAFIRLSTNGSGGVTVADAFNVTTGSLVLGVFGITVPFASAMANTNYTVVGTAAAGQPLAFFVNTRNTTSVIIYVMTYAALGSPLNPNSNSFSFEFAVYGAQ